MNDRHSNGRTEAAIQAAERWCDAQPIDEHGFAPEPVGIMRQLVSRLMEHDEGLSVTLEQEDWALVIGTLIVTGRDSGESVFASTAEQIAEQVKARMQREREDG